MGRTERRAQDYRSLWVLMVAVGLMAGVAITSCGGGGGGGSDGELCDQCGDDPDGPCITSYTIFPEPSASPPASPNPRNTNIPQCTDPVDAEGKCAVRLQCRRKVDSGQRRCFPLAPGGEDVDYQFRCDGSRPGGTPRPQPTPTETAEQPTPSPQPTNCGNGLREGSEVCDGTDLNGQTCDSRGCSLSGGFLSCRIDCTAFNVANCIGTGCRATD